MVRESGSRFPRVPRIGSGRETKGVTTAVTGCVGSSFGAQARDRRRSGVLKTLQLLSLSKLGGQAPSTHSACSKIEHGHERNGRQDTNVWRALVPLLVDSTLFENGRH